MSLNQQVVQSLKKLELLLEREFVALKTQDLDDFDNIQQQKAPILRFFSESAFVAASAADKPESPTAQSSGDVTLPDQQADSTASTSNPLTPELTELARHCQTLHRRNEILINRKLEAVRGALQALQSPAHSREVEVYDRLGKLAGGHTLKRPIVR
ncbi:MAG: flagellar export chaperone FlgN [SAR86 cluster bacterium]